MTPDVRLLEDCLFDPSAAVPATPSKGGQALLQVIWERNEVASAPRALKCSKKIKRASRSPNLPGSMQGLHELS